MHELIGRDWKRVCGCLHQRSTRFHASGSIYSFGNNLYGQLGLGATANDYQESPALVSSATSIASVSSGYYHCGYIAGVMLRAPPFLCLASCGSCALVQAHLFVFILELVYYKNCPNNTTMQQQSSIPHSNVRRDRIRGRRVMPPSNRSLVKVVHNLVFVGQRGSWACHSKVNLHPLSQLSQL